jgi:mannose-6-phosphate isomerase-like protein (cupin superfamily)
MYGMKVKCVFVCIFLLSVAGITLAQTRQARSLSRSMTVPATARKAADWSADSCYRLAFKNDKVEAFRVEVAPQGSTLAHSPEHDYLVVSQGTSHLAVRGGASEFRLDMDDGEIQLIKGGWPHRVVNAGDAPLRLITLHVPVRIDPEHALCGLGTRRNCTDGRFGKTEHGTYTYSTLFETETVQLRRFEIEPGVTLPDFRMEAGCLVVARTDLHLSNDVLGKGTTETRTERGSALWLGDGCVRGATNAGKETVQFLTLEIKPQ